MQKLINPTIGQGNNNPQTQECSHPSATCPQCISINETNHQSVVALANHPCTCSQLLSCFEPCTSTSCPVTCNGMSYACPGRSGCGLDPGETYICSAFNPRCFVIQKVNTGCSFRSMATIEAPILNGNHQRYSKATETTIAQKCNNDPNRNQPDAFHHITSSNPSNNNFRVINQHGNYGNSIKSICRRNFTKKQSSVTTGNEGPQTKSLESNLTEESRNKKGRAQEESIVGKDGIEEQEGGKMNKNISTSPDKNVIEKSSENETAAPILVVSLVTTATSTPTETTQSSSSSFNPPVDSTGQLVTSSLRPSCAPEKDTACCHLRDTCPHCADSSRRGVSLSITTSTTTFPGVAVSAGNGLCTESAASFTVGKDQGRTTIEESQFGAMDATYTMTNINTAPSNAPLLAHPHHHHSTQIQYQSPPTNHSGPLLATPILPMIDNHYLTSTPSGTFVNPACLAGNNNDPQQLQHVMIPGMIATHSNKGYSSQEQLPNADPNGSIDVSLPNGSSPGQDDGEQLRTALRQQLEYYFSKENLSHDVYLLTQMDSEQYVPISTIAGFEKVRKLTDNMDLIVQVLRESQVVLVDETGTKVKPIRDRKGVLILREIPDGTTNEEIESLFQHESCPRFVNVEFICNRNWYVTFDSDEDAQRALKYLTEHIKNFKGRPLLARIKARTTIQAYSGYKSGARSPVMAIGADQVPVAGRQPSAESGPFIASTPIQNYPAPFFQPSAPVLQSWPPGTTTCYDLSSVINFNGLSPQLAYKPISTSSGPRGQYNRNSFPRKNYYNHNHNGPRHNSVANNSSYHYSPHQQQQTAPLVTVPHPMQSVGDNSGYSGGSQETHYMLNGNNTVNLPSEKGQPAPMFNQRVSVPVPYSPSNYGGQSTVVSVHSSAANPAGYQTHSYNSFKPQSQSSDPIVNSSNDSNPSNSYQSSTPRVAKQNLRTQQLNHQVPEFVPSNPIPTITPVIDDVRNPAPVEESNSYIESESSVSQIAQASSNIDQRNSKVVTKSSNATVKSTRGNRRGGHRRDGDNASNCSGTSGQSETYSRNGDERSGNRFRGERRDHVRGSRNDSHSSFTVVAPPKFDLKDAAFPPLPFSTATNDPSATSGNADVNQVSESSDLPTGINGAAGSLADVVKGISISKNEFNISEASQKSFDSSSNDVIDSPPNIIECNGNGLPDDHGIANDFGMKCNGSKEIDDGRQNRWAKVPYAQNHLDQNGGVNKAIENNIVCNGHESSDTDDQTKVTTQSSKSMSFADVARMAKTKQPDESSSCNERNSVGKESISSVASTVSIDNVTNQRSSDQNSKNPNLGTSFQETKNKSARASSDSHRGHDGDINDFRPPRERRDRNKGSRRGGGSGKQDSRPGSRQSAGSSKAGEQVR